MTLEVNGARGEVALTVGGVDLVIAATMKGLAALSTALGCKTFNDLFERLSLGEINAAMNAVRLLAVKGDGAKAADAMELSDMPGALAAFNKAIGHHLGDKSKNDEAAKDETVDA